MNSALFHAARPGDIRSGGARARGLGGGGQGRAGMREAAAVAKEMGFGQDFGPQAANMWKMLDDLAVTDSAAYAEMAKAGAEALRNPKGKFFTPEAGFVVKGSLQRPWAPPLIRTNIDGGSGSGNESTKKVVETAAAGTKVFINLCCHDGVSPPIDQADREVDVTTEGRNASGLRIPMFVSPVRETTDHSDDRALAVDVVFHPWVLRCSKGEPFFRDQVVALATGWITQEHPGLVISRRRKLLKLCTYKGGGGRKGGTPVPFPANDASAQAQSPDERQSKRGSEAPRGNGGGGIGGVLDDPKSLLAAMKGSANGDEQAAAAAGEGGQASREYDGQNSKPASATSTSMGERRQREKRGRETGAELRLNPSGMRKESELLLPGALAGLQAGGGKRAGKGPGEGRRGPLISEISPDTTSLLPDGSGGGLPETTGKVKGVQEVRGEGGAGHQEPTAVHGQGARRRVDGEGSPAVKKGFLSSSKGGGRKGGGKRTPLYPPSGSENGAEPSAYVKLMSRCKVVDTRDHSKEEMDAAMKAHAGGGITSYPPSTTPRTPTSESTSPTSTAERISGKQPTKAAVKRGFLGSGAGGGSLYGAEGSHEGGGVRGGNVASSRADRTFDRLVALADPDMGDGADGASKTSHGVANDPMTEQLAQLAKILGPTTPFLEPAVDPPYAAAAAVSSSPSSPTMSSQTETATRSGMTKRASSPLEGNSAAAKTLDDVQKCSPPQGRAGGTDDTGAIVNGINKKGDECPMPVADTDEPATDGTTQPAVVAHATEVGKAPMPSASMTPEALSPTVLAPTSTITQAKDADGTRTIGLKTPPLKKTPTVASSPARQQEREPIYRVNQLPPSTEATGVATKPKRAFAVIIELPELIVDLANSKSQDEARDDERATRGNTSGSGRGGKMGPSLSDVELDVSPAVLELKVPGKYHLRLEMPCIVDESAVTAKFNKSRAVLRVLVREK